MEVQPDAEHQQNDADFGQLIGQVLIGDKSGRIGADGQPGQQIPDNRRQAQPLSEIAQRDRCRECPGQRQQQVEIAHAF